MYEYQAAENSQSNAEERADKEIFRESFLQLRKSCDRLPGQDQSYQRGRLNQYCRHDQKAFQPTDVHPGVFDLFCSLARPFHSGREITSQITNEISACKNNGHVDNSRSRTLSPVAADQLNWDFTVSQLGRIRNHASATMVQTCSA